jgi:hypothetical protein
VLRCFYYNLVNPTGKGKAGKGKKNNGGRPVVEGAMDIPLLEMGGHGDDRYVAQDIEM